MWHFNFALSFENSRQISIFILHPDVPEFLKYVNAAIAQIHVSYVYMCTELCTLETTYSPMSRCLRHGPLCVRREVIGHRDLKP